MAKVKIVSDRLNTFFTNNRIATGTAAPTSGTWKVGDIVISTTQSGVIGWVCTIAGTPGTWETIQSKEDLSAAFAAKTHTHNYAGSSSAGGAATSALACTGNAATATKATQDSAGQQINKTYIKGLSVSGKTITYTKGDGTTGTITTQDTNTTYSTGTATTSGLTKLYTGTGTATDGTMTQAAINTALSGKANSSHTHNYAGSSSAGGAANSANTLATARTINGTSFNGSANITTANWGTARNLNGVSVNGSTNYTIPVENYYCNVSNSNTNLYHRILTTDIATANWTDKSLIIVIHSGYNGGGFGIAKITFRTNDISSAANSQGEIKWLVRNGFAANALVFNIVNQAKNACMDVFYKSPGAYAGMTWYVLSEGRRGGAHSKQWTKYNTDASGTNAYTEANMKTLRTYASTLVSATDAGHVSTANSASTLTTARTINGTSFNGSANITTANWGTARTLTIGNTGKSVNGAGNVSWSLSEIGAAAASHGNHVPTTQTANARVFLRNDNTWQTLPSASTSATGIVQLNNAINSTSTTQAATANAAKLAYDKGVEALNKANQAFQSASDGKRKIATAITGKGVAASSSDTFDSLATKISSISTGKKWASGKCSYQSIKTTTNIDISCDFEPSVILVKVPIVSCVRDGTFVSNTWIRNNETFTYNNPHYTGNTSKMIGQISNLSSNSFTIDITQNNNSAISLVGYFDWYAFE